MAVRASPYAFKLASAELKADATVFFEALRACYHGHGSGGTLAEASDLTELCGFRRMGLADDDPRSALLQEPERVFANRLAFPGTPGAVTFTLLESYFDTSTSKWHCHGLRGHDGESFSVELPGSESRVPSFAQLSKALTEVFRGSFIYLLCDGESVDPLNGERSIPTTGLPSGQKRPRERSPPPAEAVGKAAKRRQEPEQAQQYRRGDSRSPSRRRESPAALDFASLGFLPGRGGRER